MKGELKYWWDRKMCRGFAKDVRAFTLVEFLATVVIIVILAAITLGVAGYVQRRVATGTAKVQIAAMSAALEIYKSDWGYYPVTSTGRISSSGNKEGTNNWYLYRALIGTCTGCTKQYMKFSASMVRSNMQIPQTISGTTTNMQYGLFDPWGTLYNYYCSPSTVFGIISNYSVGGQVNVGSFDLFSYGPDRVTFVSTTAPSFTGAGWTKPASANDDITNWKQ